MEGGIEGDFLVSERVPAGLPAIDLKQSQIFLFRRVLFSTTFYFHKVINLYIYKFNLQTFSCHLLSENVSKEILQTTLYIIYTYDFL
jgi:hypothetical protein